MTSSGEVADSRGYVAVSNWHWKCIPTNTIASMVDTEVALRKIAGRNSHPEFPLLRANYSPASRYPASDFTGWIADRIAQDDRDALAFLLTKLTGGNPGMGCGPDDWAAMAHKLIDLDIQRSIESEDHKAIHDLRCALFPFVLHGSLDGFMLQSLHVEYLAGAISPYRISIINLKQRVDAANRFIRKMRKETRYSSGAWTDFPLLKADDVARTLEPGPPSQALRYRLREVAIGSRLLFLGTLEEGVGQGGWKVRPFGVDEEKSNEELVAAGLGVLRDDQELLLSTYRNEELFTALAGYPIKQGWKKKYIIKFMRENAPEIAVKLCDGKTVFEPDPVYMESGKALNEWTQSMVTPLALALGFGQD
jgi:hypothetical protein